MEMSPFGRAKAKITKVVMGIYLSAFLLGVGYQLIVPMMYVLGAFSAVFLLRLAATRWLRR